MLLNNLFPQQNQLICAISYSTKRLGAAIYDGDEKEIKVFLDVAEDNDFIMLTRLLRELKPTHVLANRSQDAEFQMHLRKECNHLIMDLMDNSGISESTITNQSLANKQSPLRSSRVYTPVSVVPDSQASTPMLQTATRLISNSRTSTTTISSLQGGNKFTITNKGQSQNQISDEQEKNDDIIWQPSMHFLPDVSYGFGLARKRLEQVFGDGIHDEKLIISFRFDFTATNMIRSLGALLRFIEQQNAGPTDSSSGKTIDCTSFAPIDFNLRTCIDKISTYILPNCIEVDSGTLRALEIFYSDYVPQSIRQKFVWGNNRREGMSIFKLCNLCRSTAGRQMLRMWFERPTMDLALLAERHEAIAYLYQDCNLEITTYLRNFMKDIGAVKGIFRRMRRGNLPISDWKNFFATVCTLVKIGTYLKEREVNLSVLKKKPWAFDVRLQQVATLLIEVIDFQETLAENRLVVCKAVDEHLDKKKELYEKLPEELTKVARMEAEDICIETCSVAYVPIIGYLLMTNEAMAIPQSTETLLELIFTSEGMSYYKTKRMRLLDENVGDIKMQIIDAETNIVLNLQKRLLDCRTIVLQAVEMAATLDCLISLSQVARKYNWIRPKFVDRPVLEIEYARHPIAEHLCNSGKYVPNPIISSTEIGKVKVLFGPNASGKSVYLKMVGAIAYLACVGSFVPAQRATIGPINRIMSRMYTVDSVLDGMSSFANDLKQMARAISRSDENSLLIIDEFGKGTMTEVGLSLLASSLNYWLEGPIEKCPHVFVASHFHALPELLHDPNNLVRFQTMGVSKLDDDTLDFHFNLVDGITDLSYAAFTALKMGIPRAVVDRSEEIYMHLRAGGTLAELGPIPMPVHKTTDSNKSRQDSEGKCMSNAEDGNQANADGNRSIDEVVEESIIVSDKLSLTI